MTVFEFCGVALVLIVMVAVVLMFFLQEKDQAASRKEQRKLAGRVVYMEAEIERLKEDQAKRLPHNSAAAIEDALSALLNASRLHSELKNQTEALEYWMQQAAYFAKGARGDEYDPEKPNGGKVRRS